jgi:hypothetical protein
VTWGLCHTTGRKAIFASSEINYARAAFSG